MNFKVGDEVSIKAEIMGVDSEYVRIYVEGYGERNFNLEYAPIEKKTYTQGLADAWELAKKIQYSLTSAKLEEIFGTDNESRIMDTHTPEEALAKIEAYEKEKKIKVGDEVRNNVTGNTFWIIAKSEENLIGYSSSPEFHDFPIQRFPKNFDVLVKTGRTTDAIDLLGR